MLISRVQLYAISFNECKRCYNTRNNRQLERMCRMYVWFLFIISLQIFSFPHVLSEIVITNITKNKVRIKTGLNSVEAITGDSDLMFFSVLKYEANQDLYRTCLRVESGKGIFSQVSLFNISISRILIEQKIERMHHTGNYLQIPVDLSQKKGLGKFLPNCYTLKSNDLGITIR